MRKDVKLGLAVGGVLLAVLVVYVLVVPGNGSEPGATLTPVEGSESGDGATSDGADPADDINSRSDRASNDRSTDPGVSTQDQYANRNGGASADGDAANGADDPAGANTGASTSDRSTGESADGGWNWDALVNGTEKLPSLGAGTDVPTSDASVLIANDGGLAGNGSVDGGTTFVNNLPAGNGSAASFGNGTTTGAIGNASDTAQNAGTVVDATTAGSTQSPSRPNTGAVPPRDAAPAPVTGSARTHVVKIGDTYSSISAAAYGSSKHYAHIEHANPGIDPTKLKPGMTITLPAIDTHSAATPNVVARQQPQQLDASTQYKVQPNDSLYTISIRLYGKADRVEKLYELNKAVIGDDMARVKVGTVLKLPEPPTQSAVAATAR